MSARPFLARPRQYPRLAYSDAKPIPRRMRWKSFAWALAIVLPLVGWKVFHG